MIEFIVNNQLSRRNLSESQKAYLRGKRYSSEKKRVGNPNQLPQGGAIATREKLANEFGVGKSTIDRFASAVDVLAEAGGPQAKANTTITTGAPMTLPTPQPTIDTSAWATWTEARSGVTWRIIQRPGHAVQDWSDRPPPPRGIHDHDHRTDATK